MQTFLSHSSTSSHEPRLFNFSCCSTHVCSTSTSPISNSLFLFPIPVSSNIRFPFLYVYLVDTLFFISPLLKSFSIFFYKPFFRLRISSSLLLQFPFQPVFLFQFAFHQLIFFYVFLYVPKSSYLKPLHYPLLWVLSFTCHQYAYPIPILSHILFLILLQSHVIPFSWSLSLSLSSNNFWMLLFHQLFFIQLLFHQPPFSHFFNGRQTTLYCFSQNFLYLLPLILSP